MEFPTKFHKKAYQQVLEKIALKYTDLTNKWILNQPVNKLYSDNRHKKTIKNNDLEYYALIDWILPSTSYQYTEINLNDLDNITPNYKIARSSFIPVTKMPQISEVSKMSQMSQMPQVTQNPEINNHYYWLLGSFVDYPNEILSDFGGTFEKKDCDFLQCALRELKEETHDLLNPYILQSYKNPKNVAVFKGVNHLKKLQIFFIFVYIPYTKIEHIPNEFKILNKSSSKSKEQFGELNFYRQTDIHNFKYKLSKNLTDLILSFHTTD